MEKSEETKEIEKEPISSNENSQDTNESDEKLEKTQNFDDILENDEELKKKLKGDSIGNTMYSEKFVLETLLQLKEHQGKLDRTFESKLEILWDTTLEKSVVQLLLSLDFLDIAGYIIDNTDDERLIEILLGIIANMACHSDTREQLCAKKEVMSVLLSQLSSSDPLILHQLMRLLHSAIIFENSGDEVQFFNHFKSYDNNLVEKFSFILANSTSNTLLMSSFEALNGICAKFAMIECQIDSEKDQSFPQMFVKKVLVEAMIEAFKQVIPNIENTTDTTDIIPTQNQQKFMNIFLELNIIVSQYESLSIEAYKDVLPEFQKCLSRILLPLTHKMYLLPLNSYHQGIIENINDTMQSLQDKFDENLFSQMVIIWDLIEEDKNKDKSWSDGEDSNIDNVDIDDLSMTILEFLTRMGFNGDQHEFTASLKKLNLDLAMKLFERINDNNDEPECEITNVIDKMKTSIKAIWEIDLD